MRIAFAGTPPFAACALAALIEAGHDIALVLTQPDRPSGRGMKLKPSAVKELALKHDLPVITPLSLSTKRAGEEAEQALKALEDAAVDLLIVAAYGLILPQRALDAAKGIGESGQIRSMNIHASLLPRWRGAAPIQRAIMSGDSQTGVTLMKMEAGLDTGPMIEIGTTPISDTDTSASLTDRLALLGAQMVVDVLKRPTSLKCTPQPEDGVTYAEKILKTESPVDWSMSAIEISRRVRAFNPFPFVTATRNGEMFKIREAKAVEGNGRPGEVLVADKKLVIACGQGALECTKLQKAGKPEMPVSSFLQSFEIHQGEVLS